MPQGPLALASTSSTSTSTSTSTSPSRGVSVKPPPPNGINMTLQTLCSSRGESKRTHSIGVNGHHKEAIGVIDPTRTTIKLVEREENKVSEQSIGDHSLNTNDENEMIQSTVVIREEVVMVTTTPEEAEPSGTVIKIEIAKSILYGGLIELIASLGGLTSAAATNATTREVVVCSLASLITGAFVMTYKISELWIKEHIESEAGEAEDGENSERYENVFGDRKNYRLHFSVAILSFIVFGLVPPLVYGFTFCKPEQKTLKIPTVTIVTVLCIALLGVAKAYIERKTSCPEYINIMGKCIVDALGTTVLSTIGGDLIGNYIEKTGWFEPNKIPTLLFHSAAFSFQNATSTWGPLSI